jgi:hypothetical protein
LVYSVHALLTTAIDTALEDAAPVADKTAPEQVPAADAGTGNVDGKQQQGGGGKKKKKGKK